MTEDLVIDYSEPWRETETFLRLLPGPRFSTPPTDENGVVIRHYSTTVSRKLRDHPKMRVDLSDPDDREIVARRVWRCKCPALVGVLLLVEDLERTFDLNHALHGWREDRERRGGVGTDPLLVNAPPAAGPSRR